MIPKDDLQPHTHAHMNTWTHKHNTESSILLGSLSFVVLICILHLTEMGAREVGPVIKAFCCIIMRTRDPALRRWDRKMAGACWLSAQPKKYEAQVQGGTLPQRNSQSDRRGHLIPASLLCAQVCEHTYVTNAMPAPYKEKHRHTERCTKKKKYTNPF